jgi:uncharacterized membrane protein
MKEDLLVVAGVLVASAVCAWYVMTAVAGIVHPIPTDDTCTVATQCLASVMAL